MLPKVLPKIIQGENLQKGLLKSDHRQWSSQLLATFENQA